MKPKSQRYCGMKRFYVGPSNMRSDHVWVYESKLPIYKLEQQGFEVFNDVELAINHASEVCKNKINIQLENIENLGRLRTAFAKDVK